MNRLSEHKLKEFLLTDIFSVDYGNKFDLNKMEVLPTSSIAFVSRTAQNNGVSAYVEPVTEAAPYPAGAITVALGGSIGSTFLQKQPFYTGQNVSVLLPKTPMSDEAKLFITCIIMTECSYRFIAFGRELNKHIKRDFTIKLPQTVSGTPDWQAMSDFMAELEAKGNLGKGKLADALQTKNPEAANAVSMAAWGSFRIEELFERFEVGKAHAGMLDDGDDCLYLGAKKDDNCVMQRCARNPDLVQPGNCIVFICNGEGSVGYANYMDREFIATTDLVMGYAEKLNKYNGLFIVTILDRERPKYSFGRKWKTHLRDTIIKLPKTKDGKPDWDEMERRIKVLPYGDRI